MYKLKEGAKELDACLPCQLYKPMPAPSAKHNYTSQGHPQTNGKVERLNHELIQ